ncbi:DUF4339 domain-containing protein [Mesorhizobium sp. ES1-4]|uniref:DUF4339 domain-containing protein n=1 Tax=Mesorhizobium sp. ES1-4 TaxID=2876627 RepID=UPI001CCB1B06|nr:DUF4339 domain-containing protein [Mesorhizobium sp. ES1-4]MBZ9795586.1 DUF4339 domain-containing protein [Mesorhizobium sp. ES1-4]
MAEWYFEENGAQRGPVSEGDLNTMLVNHLLPPGTLVWTASLGTVWKPASQTHLEAAPQRLRPPPLPQVAVAPPPLPAAHRSALLQNPGGVVSASSSEWPSDYRPEQVAPHDDYAKWLAFSPLLLLVIDLVLFANGNDVVDGPFAGATPFLGAWGSLIFASLDARNIYRSWRNPKHRALIPFVLLSPIGYFWRRAWLLKKGFGYLWVWLACAAFYMVVLGAMMQRA